jgi:glyoxylase-like metal-dependent hydrolase (beta-lactamase superfamily II)
VTQVGNHHQFTEALVEEVQKGLWHWKAPHPEWEEGESWDPNVSSYAIDTGEQLALFDPLGVPGELLALAPERDTLIILSAPWHERDSQALVEQLGAPVYTSTPDSAEDLMRMFNVSAELAGDGSPDLKWLLREGQGEAHVYQVGDQLPLGIQVYPGHRRNDNVLWIASHRAVLVGDTLIDFGEGLGINENWLIDGMTREKIVEQLRPLLALPVAHVLAAHGGPFDRAALERVLA